MAIQTSANNQVTVLSASWNSATTPYTALKVDVNNILTPTGSLLFDVGTNTGTYTSRFAIDVSGSVGVGTASPSGKFEVVGVSGSLLLVTDVLSGSLFSVNDITGLPIFEVFSDDTVVAGTVNSNTLVVTGSNIGIGTRTPTLAAGRTVHFHDTTQPVLKWTNNTTGVAAANGVNMSVAGNDFYLNNQGSGQVKVYTSGTERLTILSTGNTGIGTVTPGTRLHVNNTGNEQFWIMGGGAGYLFSGYDQTNSRGRIGAYTGASYTNLLINEGGGNVGIGVNTNPVTTLDVNGVINTATGFRIANAATPAGRYLRADGTNFVSSAIVAGDVPTLNQNTTGQAGSVANAVTFNNGGAGDASGTTFNGSAARTISYNTVGAPSTTGTNASGTWGISISGNAATATSAATLTTARNINGTSFNGSADITVPVNTSQRSDNVTYHIPFVAAVTAGNQSLFTDSLAELTYNPSTNTLTTTTFAGALSGNATTATTLQTARNINGISFNGSAAITVPVNTTQKSDNVSYNIPFVGSVTAGNQDLYTDSAANLTYNPSTNALTTTTFIGALTGNASTATKFAAAVTLWGQSFDGSANVTGNLTSVGDITGTGAVTLTATGGTLGLAATLSNVITATTNGSEAMRIDSSQRVGIGTASSDTRLNVYTTNANGTDGLRIFGGATTSNVRIRPAMSAGANNNIVQAGDSGIIYDAGSQDTGAFVIAPWATSTSGLRMTSGGNVGIGTATISARLHVQGTSVGTDTTFLVRHNVANGSNLPVLDVQNSAGTSLLFVSGSGNIGIGTNTPTARLHINTAGTSVDGPALKVNHSAGSGYGYAQFGNSSTATQNWHIGSEGDGSFRWYNGTWGGGSELMRINSAGSVGIGTVDPITRLHVQGTGAVFSSVRSSTTAQYDGAYFDLYTTGASTNYGSTSLQHILLSGADTTNTAFQIQLRSTTGSFVSSLYTIDYKNCAHIWSSPNATGEKMRLSLDGNLGIRTSSPVNNVGFGGLTINGTSGAILSHMVNGTEAFRIQSDGAAHNINGISDVPLILYTNSSERVRIANTTGNVGVGTTDAGTYRLSVRTTAAYASSKFESAVTTNSTTLDAGEFFQMSANTANSSVTFGAADGRVLTANVTPSANEVVWRANKMGLVATDYIVFKPNGGTEIMRITAGLKVGIGTTAPSSNVTRLDVRNEGGGGISGPTSGVWTAQIVNNNDISSYNGLSVHNRWTASDSIIFEAAAGWNGSAAGYYPVFTVLGNGTSIFKNNAGTEIARVDSGGTVGVGTATISTARMQIQGTSTGSDTTLRVRHNVLNGSNLPVLDVQNQAGTSLLFVSGSGRVGIGSTTPGAPIDIVGGSTGAPYLIPPLRLRASAGSGYGLIQIGDSSTATNNWHIGSEGDGRFLFYNGTFGSGTERLKITNSTGDVTIATGNLVIGTSGKGIDFSATAGTGTSELLDDYEEGTWSPTFTCGTSGTITVDTASGETQARYTKIGRVVHIAASIGISAVSSPSGFLQINNLPFASAATWAAFNGVAGYAEHYLGTGYSSTFAGGQVQIYSSDSILYYSYYTTSAGWASLSAARFTASSYLGFSFTYITDA